MRLLVPFILTLVALGIGGLLWHQLYRRYRYTNGQRPSLFPALLIVGVVCRLAYTFLTPTFYAPDEQSHFNHIKFIATQGEFATQTTKLGDPTNEWEHNQPPLYYLALAPIYRFAMWLNLGLPLTVILLRSFSFLLWLVNLWFGLTLLNRLQITHRVVRTCCLAMLCLLPTYTFSSAAINNDNLLITLSGGLLCLLSRRNYSVKTALFTGLTLGLALLTKQSAIVFIPVVATLVGTELLKNKLPWKSGMIYLSLALGSAFLIYLPWLVRNWQVYHTLTPEFQVVETIRWPSFAYGCASAAHNLVKSFWAVSGIANNIAYPFPLVGMLLLAACFAAGQIGFHRKRTGDALHSNVNQPLLLALWIGVLINLLLVLRFGYLFGMGQGRHLFPVLLPIALLMGNWLRAWNVVKLEVHLAGGWMVYALTFTAYSLARFPR